MFISQQRIFEILMITLIFSKKSPTPNIFVSRVFQSQIIYILCQGAFKYYVIEEGKAFESYTSVQTPYHSYSTFNTKLGNSYTQVVPYKTILNHQTPLVLVPGIKSKPTQNHPTFATQHVETPFDWYKTYGYKPANLNLPFKSFLTKPNQESQLKRINKPTRIPIPVKIVTARPVEIKRYGYKPLNKPAQAFQLKKTNKQTENLILATGTNKLCFISEQMVPFLCPLIFIQ